MRWQGQELGVNDDAALPGLERMDGLVRSVTTPEFAGMTFHEVLCKSALNHVPSASAMPFEWTVNPYRGCSHACSYCLSPDTMVLTAEGHSRPIGELSVGDMIIGTEPRGAYRRYTATRVMARWRTRKRAFRVVLADGTELVASADHRFLTERGWKFVTAATTNGGQRPYLTLNNRMMGFGTAGAAVVPPVDDDEEYRRGYLCGMIRGDGMIFHRTYRDEVRTREVHRFRLALADDQALDRTRSYLMREGISTLTRPFTSATSTRRAMVAIHSAKKEDVARIEHLIDEPRQLTREWQAGFLAGIFDAEGSCSRGVLRIVNKNHALIETVRQALADHRVPFVQEPVRANGVITIRVVGGLPVRQRFFELSRPAIDRKLTMEGLAVKTTADLRIVSIEDLGTDVDMVDITTGTGDFIANGVISHNCFARGTHEYLDLDAGHDFDSQIVVKINVAEVLQREVRRGSWRHQPVALGTNTDPYQRAEGRYRLMPGIIGALTESGTPFSILTKGTLLRRDLPLIADAASHVDVSLAMSIAVYDDALQKSVEPGTPSAAARLDTVRAATDAGFRVTVFMMPVLPHLTDSIPQLDDALARIKAAGATRVVFGALHLRPGVKPWFLQWLGREHPELVSSYLGLYPGASVTAPKAYRTWLGRRMRPLLHVHRLDGRAEEDSPRRGPLAGIEVAPTVITTSKGRAAAEPAPPARLF